MDKKLLKTSLNTIWALVLLANQKKDLNFNQLKELRAALNTIRDNWSEDDGNYGRATRMCEWIDTSGILSVPPRKPQGTEGIMQDCQLLQRYLDSN